MTRTLLCLARHGETNWNLERRFQGQFDIALNVKGRAQADALAHELAGQHFDHIYSSDLKRAAATAAPLAAERGSTVNTTPALREKHNGIWQGLTHPEVAARYPEDYVHYRTRRPDFAIPGGESLERFRARVAPALTEIAQAHAGQTVLVVAHAGVLDIAWRLATGKRLDETREYPMLNATPNWIAYDGAWSLVDWAKEDGRPPILAPYDGLTLPRRAAARLLVLNPRGEVLLLRYSSRLAPHFLALGHDYFWGTPGGALEHGESFETAARRELLEETGLAGVDVGAVVVATREFPMELRDCWVHSVERYFVVRARDFTPDPHGFTAGEKADVTGWKWWSAAELAGCEELVFPEGLEAELRRLA